MSDISSNPPEGLNVILRTNLRGEASKPVPLGVIPELQTNPNATVAVLRQCLVKNKAFRMHESDLFVYPTTPVDYVVVPKSKIVPVVLESRLPWKVLKNTSSIPTIEILIASDGDTPSGIAQRVNGTTGTKAPQHFPNTLLSMPMSAGTSTLGDMIERLAPSPPPENEEHPPTSPTWPATVNLSDVGALIAMTTALTILRGVATPPPPSSKPPPLPDDDGDAADVARYNHQQWNDLIRFHKLLHGVKMGNEDGPVRARKPLLEDFPQGTDPKDEVLYKAAECTVPTEATMSTVTVDNSRDCKYTTKGWTKAALKVSPPYLTVGFSGNIERDTVVETNLRSTYITTTHSFDYATIRFLEDEITLSPDFLNCVREALQPLEGYNIEDLESLDDSSSKGGDESSTKPTRKMETLRRYVSRLPFHATEKEPAVANVDVGNREDSRPGSPADTIRERKEACDEARRRFQALFKEYGEVFALEVTLGGSISDVQRVESTDRHEVEKKSYEMESELTAAVLGIGESTTVHNEHENDSKTTYKRSAHNYRYRGGEPKAAGDIGKWKTSLQRDNWITCKTDKVVPILDLIPNNQRGFEHLKRIIELLFPKPPLLGRWVKGSPAVRGSQEFMGREVFYSHSNREGWYILGQSLSSDRVLLVKERTPGAICQIERTIGVWDSESRWWTKHDEYLFDLEPTDPVRYATIGSGFFMIPRTDKKRAIGWSLDEDLHMPSRFCAVNKDYLVNAECRNRIWSASRYWWYPTTWLRPRSYRKGTAWRIATPSRDVGEQMFDLEAFKVAGSRNAPTGNIWMLKKSAITIINEE
ncbi:hypothetical protein FRB91_007108 [Serendipita sp. 411]|nr:hypothetical protein FRB91_007108 [Serendipita sp. 411]